LAFGYLRCFMIVVMAVPGQPRSLPPQACKTWMPGTRPGMTMDRSEEWPRGASPVRCIERQVLGDLPLPAIAVRKQPLLVVVKLLAGLGGELEIGPFHNRVDRAGLLAEPAIDAFHHVDVVTGSAASTVIAAWTGLDGDGLGRANRFAQFASNAALFAVGVAPQRMLAAKARRQRPALERVVQRRFRPHEVFQREPER